MSSSIKYVVFQGEALQGYIASIVKLKGEDIIVKVITRNRFLSLYRFYGVRHSIISIGRKIDFEIENNGIFMPRLRNVTQLNFDWELDNYRLYHWQTFLKLLSKHLFDTEEIPQFYFELLNKASRYFSKQSPTRVLINSYASLLEFEGRRVLDRTCMVCGDNIGDSIVVVRGYLCAHKQCIPNNFHTQINSKKFFSFLESKKCLEFNNDEVDYLLHVMMEGL